MLLESITENDLVQLNDLPPKEWGDIRDIHSFYLNNKFCTPMKLILENRIAGIGTAIQTGNTGWLAHIIVHEELRKQGIGNSLVENLLKYLKEDCNCTSISLIATDQGFPLYKKYGFSTQNEYIAFASENAPTFTICNENIRPMKECDYPEVLILDSKISGENRSSILRQFFSCSYVYSLNHKIVGFYTPNLGEGLIIADDETAGIELLKLKISKGQKIVLPAENKVARNFLLKNEFQEKLRVKRMIFGREFEWCPQNIYSRIGGYLG